MAKKIFINPDWWFPRFTLVVLGEGETSESVVVEMNDNEIHEYKLVEQLYYSFQERLRKKYNFAQKQKRMEE